MYKHTHAHILLYTKSNLGEGLLKRVVGYIPPVSKIDFNSNNAITVNIYSCTALHATVPSCIIEAGFSKPVT